MHCVVYVLLSDFIPFRHQEQLEGYPTQELMGEHQQHVGERGDAIITRDGREEKGAGQPVHFGLENSTSIVLI